MSINRASPTPQQQLVSDTARAAFGSAAALSLTDTQAAALQLYGAGLQVFPLPYASKLPWQGYRHEAFRYARPRQEDVEAMFAGEPCNIAVQAGRISGNLVVVDAETPQLFGELMATAARAGLPLWAVRTHRGGHLYLRCADGEIQNVRRGAVEDLPDVEIHGHSRYVLGPESVHPDGTIYDLIRRDGPEPPAATLDELRAAFPELPFKLASHAKRGRPAGPDLTARTTAFLQGEIPVGERNNQLYTSARELLGRGWSEDVAYQGLMRGAALCGLDERGADATFRSAVKGHYRDGDIPDSIHRPNTVNPAALWYLAAQWAEGETWQGRSGSTDRAVFLALVERLKLEHPDAVAGQRVTWRASVRELSELTGYTIKTISAALKRLQERKAVRLANRALSGYRYGFGKAVRLVVATATDSSGGECITTTLYENASSSVVVMHSDHPAFDRGALGANAAGVLSVLLGAGAPLMPTAISRRGASLTVWKVRTALDRLQQWRLAERLDEGWVTSVDAAQLAERLDEVAMASGAFEAVRARQERHRQERADRLLDIVLRARGMLLVASARPSGLKALQARLASRAAESPPEASQAAPDAATAPLGMPGHDRAATPPTGRLTARQRLWTGSLKGVRHGSR